MATVPARYKAASFLDFSSEKIKPVLDWVSNDLNEILFIFGGSGCGKTHLMCAITNALNSAGRRAAYVLIPEIALELRDSMTPDFNKYIDEMSVIKKYRNGKLVGVFDDLAANKPSDYVAESLYAIINHRYQECYSSVYSSNLSISQISEIYGDRIASRIASGVVFNLGEEDRRMY
jgi:DNA replication protein DnaC